MTDNCGELGQGLREKWSQSTLLLCVFHILQQVWRWIYGKEHGISAADRLEIMRMFKALLYSEDEERLRINIESIQENATIQV